MSIRRDLLLRSALLRLPDLAELQAIAARSVLARKAFDVPLRPPPPAALRRRPGAAAPARVR